MKFIFYPLGVLRIALLLLVLILILLLVLLTAKLPIKRQGVTLAAWICTWGARICMAMFGLSVSFKHHERLTGFTGFIFANHSTFVDILLLIAMWPGRFLAAHDIAGWPLIGLIAKAVGTVFVNRDNKDSRAAARDAVLAAPKYPPIMIYPQGGINNPGSLPPFRYGAFEMAIASGVPFIPCAIQYQPHEVMAWYCGPENARRESMPEALWRMACYPRVKHASVSVLEPVPTHPDDTPATLAKSAYDAINGVLGWPAKM